MGRPQGGVGEGGEGQEGDWDLLGILAKLVSSRSSSYKQAWGARGDAPETMQRW